MKWIKRGLLAFLGLILLLIAAELLLREYEAQRFYGTRPISRAMAEAARAATKETSRSQSERAEAVLQTYLPTGTSRSEAIRIVGQEGFICSHIPRTDNDWTCGIKSTPEDVFKWIIQLSFDKEDKLTRARVLSTK